MIHGTPTGRNVRQGSMISGLQLTERDSLHVYAIDDEGHEWFTDFSPMRDTRAAFWEHRPSTCNACHDKRYEEEQRAANLPWRGGDFNNPRR